MSNPTILPTGQLHPDLVKNAAFVKYVNNETSTPAAAPAPKIHGGSEAELQELSNRLTADWRAGKMDVIDLSPHFSQSGSEAAGKKVIDNRAACGFIVETIDPNVFTAEDANKSAAAGGANHGFFYRGTDFLLEAAQEYAKLGENEVFRFRNINDVNFVRDTLDFFTNGDYSQQQVNAMQEQMTAVVQELAQQLKNGESPDLNRLQTKLNINGAEVSVGQLLDMQQTGRELAESFSGITSGSLNSTNTAAFAQMGMAKALGNYYASDKGEAGQMFAAAMDRLYERGVAQITKADAWARGVSYAANTPGNKAAVDTELKIADMFAHLDTSDKGSLSKSFASTLNQARATVQQYCKQYGLLTSHVGLAGATDNITKFFNSWLNKL